MIGNTVTARYLRIISLQILRKGSMTQFIRSAITVVGASLVMCSAVHAASGNSSNLLQYIPSDAPFAIASTKPMPSKLADKLEPTIDELLQAYQRVVRHALAEQLVKMAEERIALTMLKSFAVLSKSSLA